ncbi:MAG: hypothetical protein JNM66_29960 [Bryobacterales bacterium]|nr:hypothetical protein [Bryobacterales bacterium]
MTYQTARLSFLLLALLFFQGKQIASAQNCPKEKADTTFTPDREPVDPLREELSNSGDPQYWRYDPASAIGEDECVYHGSTRRPGRCGTPLIIEIDRVVGRGKACVDVRSSGSNADTLINPNLLIANKILAPRACIAVSISAGSVDNYFNPLAARLTLLLNGRSIGTAAIPAGTVNYELSNLSIWFDASILRYGTRQMENGQPDSAPVLPIPGQNRLEGRVTFAGNIPESRLLSFTVHSLSFEAKSPIILQHGIQGCNSYFTPSYRYNSGSPILDARIAKLLESIGAGFSYSGHRYVAESPLPLCPILPSSLMATSPIALASGRALTISFGGAALMSEVRRMARSFGASRVHIFAHSKGGLWSRHALGAMQFLEYAPPGSAEPSENMRSNRTPVIASITTVDTPHHGSAAGNVNLFLLSIQTRLEFSLIPERWNIIRELRRSALPRDDEALDLAPASVASFNLSQNRFRRVVLDRHGTSTATAFYTVSADADTQQDGVFGAEEGFNMIDSYTAQNANSALATSVLAGKVLYSVMERDLSGNPFAVLPCDFTAGPTSVNWNVLCTLRGPLQLRYVKNDLIVTRASARHFEFQELFGVWKNHSTAGECGRMRDAVQFILGSDPLAGGAPSTLACPVP